MIQIVRLPSVSPNDETAKIVTLLRETGTLVRAGEAICAIETSKAGVEIEAPAGGYLVHLVSEGDVVAVNKAIAVLTSEKGEDYAAALAAEDGAPASAAEERRWTKKAFLVARREGIDLEALAASMPGKVVGEADVLEAKVQERSAGSDLTDRGYDPCHRPERVLLLGGAAGAGVIAIDAMMRGGLEQRPVGILDNNPATHGMTSIGVPVLGNFDLIEELWEAKKFDGAVILFTDDLDQRAALFESLSAAGIAFSNIIDPSVQVRSYVRMGRGNVIMGNGFLAAGVTLGDNNFFASQNVIEHHSVIGSHCAFGPRCTLSGRVQMGDRVRLGMHVAVEPYLRIGSRAIIASGTVVTSHVPEDVVVKSSVSPIHRPR